MDYQGIEEKIMTKVIGMSGIVITPDLSLGLRQNSTAFGFSHDCLSTLRNFLKGTP